MLIHGRRIIGGFAALFAVLIFSVLPVATVSAAVPNVVVNGGFESGDLRGWTVATKPSQSGARWLPVLSGTWATSAAKRSGAYGARVQAICMPITFRLALCPEYVDSSISQSFTAPAGASRLSFWYRMMTTQGGLIDYPYATLVDNNTIKTLVDNGTVSIPLSPEYGTSPRPWRSAAVPITAGHSYSLTLGHVNGRPFTVNGDQLGFSWTDFDDVVVS